MSNPSYRPPPVIVRSPARYNRTTNPQERRQPSQPARSNMSPNSTTQRRSPVQSRRQPPPPTLPNLPRFHPANYLSPSENTSSTFPSRPSSSSDASPTTTSPDSPIQLSPRSSRQTSNALSEAQRQLYAYHRELYSINRTPVPREFGTSRPGSPNLRPLASPGAVTPLELEENPIDYLDAGANHGVGSPAAKKGS